MPQTLKRLPVLTPPPQWHIKSVPKAGGCCVGTASTLPLVPPAPVRGAQSVILNCAGLEIITGEVGCSC